MKKKIPKKTLRKRLKKKAWDLQSQYVRRKANGVCYTCGSRKEWKAQDAGHYIHKDSLDYDLINIHCQCTGCNRFRHGNLGIYGEKLIAEYGEEAIAEMRFRSNQVRKYTIDELELLVERYKVELDEMQE